MQITYFNRHQSMDSKTRKMILHTINDLSDCPLSISTSIVENWLYGSFDGYDYSQIALRSVELTSITIADPQLGETIKEIFQMISKYPKTTEPNGNQF
jgi:hypothetical protein